jgi:signal peptidase I
MEFKSCSIGCVIVVATVTAIKIFQECFNVEMESILFVVGVVVFVIAMLMKIFKKRFKTENSKKLFQDVYSWMDVVWSALIMASLIMFFLIQAFKIPSGSMRNTLCEGDHIFVNKFFYGFRIPFKYVGKRYAALRSIKRGDVVVFQCPPEGLQKTRVDFIKRCVAIGGDKVEIRDKKLYVNDLIIEEPYVIHSDNRIIGKSELFDDQDQEDYQKSWEEGKFCLTDTARDNFGPVIVPQGYYMVMGDNRDNSYDSRFWGPLSDEYVKGKAIFVWFPIGRWKIIS